MTIDEFEGQIESLTDEVADGDIPAAIMILFRNAVFLSLDLAFDQTEHDTAGLSDTIASKLLKTLNEEMTKVTG